MTETVAINQTILKCSECGCEIYTCDGCKNYFRHGDIIHCTNDNHLCESCREE